MKYLLILLFTLGCGSQSEKNTISTTSEASATYTYIALGDSYTKGESVCDSCGFPSQLVDLLTSKYNLKGTYKSIAETGWTTTNLLNAIEREQLTSEYDLVTLLIGVNNQFQGKPFSIYETEFPILLEKAIGFAKGDKNRVLVLSIPDYAFTPYGEGNSDSEKISKELDDYNRYAKKVSEENGVQFFDVTRITRNGLKDQALVAKDGLHPSEKAYGLFVQEIIGEAKKIVD
jgi:lysophospholipase L1-like esterase